MRSEPDGSEAATITVLATSGEMAPPGVLSTTSKAAVEIAMTDVMAACTEVGGPMSWGE